jgi:hypothetical protein
LFSKLSIGRNKYCRFVNCWLTQHGMGFLVMDRAWKQQRGCSQSVLDLLAWYMSLRMS